MSLHIPDRVVLFDYGEVISRSQSEADRLALTEIADADQDPFWAAYWRHRDDLDQGTASIRDYWARVASDLGANWSAPRVQQLWAADYRSWISVEPGTVELLEELHEGGTRVAMLSNAGADFGDPFRRAPMAGFFEQVFISGELGLIKPDPAIYRHVAAKLDVPLDRIVFVDNKAVNVDAAVALGCIGHRFVDVAALRAFLTDLAEAAA